MRASRCLPSPCSTATRTAPSRPCSASIRKESQLRGLFEFLLAAHAFSYATDGSSFAVDVDTSKIFLFRTFDLSRINTDEFLTDFERFILVHKRWLDAYESGRLRGQIEAGSAAVGSDPRQGMVFA